MDKEPVIRTKNLCKQFGVGEAFVKAVTDVTIDIYKQDFVALMGPSGSGKSTLLNLMSGLDRATSGSIQLKGTELMTMSEKQLSDFRRDHIGFVFQSYNLIPVLTAIENVEYVLLLQNVNKQRRREICHAILERVGLGGKEQRFPAELSGGQQQRVAIARAMASKPSIILADEPTANLDSKTGEELLEMMVALNATEHMTFVFSTHDPMIMEKSKRLISLRDGVVESDEYRTPVSTP